VYRNCLLKKATDMPAGEAVKKILSLSKIRDLTV
jgi:hypothetical protein